MIVSVSCSPPRAIKKPACASRDRRTAVELATRGPVHHFEPCSHRYCERCLWLCQKLCQTGNWCALFLRLPTAEIDHDA